MSLQAFAQHVYILIHMFTLENLRHYRIFTYAIFDIGISFVGIGLLSPLLSRLFRIARIDIPKKNWLFLTLPLGIIFHLLFGAMTPMTKNFLDIQSEYVLKIVVFGCIILGVRGIKVVKK